MVAAWAVDEHTIEAASNAVDLGIVSATLVGDEALIKDVCAKNNIDVAKFTIVNEPVELKAVAKAVQMVHDGEGDILMKGLCSTDKFLRAILNKECGLLPPKGLLSHVGIHGCHPAAGFPPEGKDGRLRYRSCPFIRHCNA